MGGSTAATDRVAQDKRLDALPTGLAERVADSKLAWDHPGFMWFASVNLLGQPGRSVTRPLASAAARRRWS